MPAKTVTLRERGTLTLPQEVRDQLGIETGSLLILEVTDQGVLLRPAIPVAIPPEEYGKRRKAELLLNNATDESDYQAARKEVERMGLDPDQIPHQR